MYPIPPKDLQVDQKVETDDGIMYRVTNLAKGTSLFLSLNVIMSLFPVNLLEVEQVVVVAKPELPERRKRSAPIEEESSDVVDAADDPYELEYVPSVEFPCDHCQAVFKTEKGRKIHLSHSKRLETVSAASANSSRSNAPPKKRSQPTGGKKSFGGHNGLEILGVLCCYKNLKHITVTACS